MSAELQTEGVRTLAQLQPGDIIRNRLSGTAYVVTENCGEMVIAVRTIAISNPPEWERITPTPPAANEH